MVGVSESFKQETVELEEFLVGPDIPTLTNKSQLFGVSVFMVMGGTKTCCSVSYLSSNQARFFESL